MVGMICSYRVSPLDGRPISSRGSICTGLSRLHCFVGALGSLFLQFDIAMCARGIWEVVARTVEDGVESSADVCCRRKSKGSK